MLVAGRRPEERALLAAAMDVVDFVYAQPGGAQLLGQLGIGQEAAPDAPQMDLRGRIDGLCRRQVESQAVVL